MCLNEAIQLRKTHSMWWCNWTRFEIWLHIFAHSPTQLITWPKQCPSSLHGWVGGDTQSHLKPCPITLPDRPGLSDFSRVHWNTWESLAPCRREALARLMNKPIPLMWGTGWHNTLWCGHNHSKSCLIAILSILFGSIAIYIRFICYSYWIPLHKYSPHCAWAEG